MSAPYFIFFFCFSFFFYFSSVFRSSPSLLCYQLAVASHLRLGSSSSLSTQSWLVVVIEFIFRPAYELRGNASSSAVTSHLRRVSCFPWVLLELELNRLENELRGSAWSSSLMCRFRSKDFVFVLLCSWMVGFSDKDRELGEAHAEIRALRLSERQREKAVEEVCSCCY